MCGICGVIALDGGLDPGISAAVPAMTAALRHRGPDSGGLYSDAGAALGHRRLAIIDTATGAQPMSNEDGTRWIVFNGEIYNHRQLRDRLIARGHVFRTTSDTEAILHGYEEYGADVVTELEGMFAFAIYDSVKREAFLARDRLGKKPLFWGVLGGAVHFASEIKSFYCSPAWDNTLEENVLEEYLSLGYIIAPRTIYRHIRKLEPGHWLRIADGRCVTQQYWDLSTFDDARYADDRAPVKEVERLLAHGVQERLESEVPLGAFLSGGIDSGLVVSFMAEALGGGVSTTTVGFSEAAHNELAAAALTAAHCRTTHHGEVVTPRLEDVLDRIVGAFDEPFADSSAIPTFYVSQIARRRVTVALTGDGGDEAFGGYSFRYAQHAVEGSARRLIGTAGRGVCGWAGRQWPKDRRLPKIFRLGTILENIDRDPASAYYFDSCFMKPNDARGLLGLPPVSTMADTSPYAAVTAPYRRCSSGSDLQRAMYSDLKVYLPNDVLVKVDRMSMQHGLEVRCPLLDRRLVELAFHLPAAVKMPGLRPKRLLRALAAERLPAALARQPKRGFSAPVGRWVAGDHEAMCRADLLGSGGASASGLFDRSRIAQLFEDQHTGRRDNAYSLWALWMFERWRIVARNAEARVRAESAQ